MRSGRSSLDSQDNAEATATIMAVSGVQFAIVAVSASFSSTTSGKLLEIKNGGTVIWRDYVYDSVQLGFSNGLSGTRGNAMSAVLAASGTGGVIGKVNICAIVV